MPFAAGGAADLFGRSLADGLSVELGQQVVVETRGSAGGLTGVDAAAKSAPDGYTIHTSRERRRCPPSRFMLSKMPFDWQKDLALLTLVVRVPEVLGSWPPLAGSIAFADFIAYARANRGKINFGSAGTGSITHLAGELVKSEVKLDLVHVPYRGVGPAVNDMIGGHIQMIVGDVPFAPAPLRRHQGARGDLGRAQLGAAGGAEHRRARLPRYQFRQLVRPRRARRHAAGDPRQAAPRRRLRADIGRAEKAVRQPERHALAHHAAEFAAFVQAEQAKWGPVVRATGAKLE